MEWQLAEAKNKFSEVVTRALHEGPQRVRRRDGVVVVVAEEEYLRLTGEQMTLKDYLLNAPDFTGVDLRRDQSPMREVDL
jgi:prevent-host-death family protein